MKKLFTSMLILTAFLCNVCMVNSAFAAKSDMDILLETLVEEKIITGDVAEKVKEKVETKKQMMANQVDASDELATKKEVAAMIDNKVPAWTKKVKVDGDVRLRHESISKTDADRQLSRVRVRVGIKAQVTDNVQVITRFASAGSFGSGVDGSIGSTNQTFTNDFSKKNLWIDMAYIKWDFLENLTLFGGKMKNPLWTSDILWDGDATPEGLAYQMSYPAPFADFLTFFSNGGVFSFDERGGMAMPQANQALYVVQAGAKAYLNEDKTIKVKAAVGYHDFTHVKDTVLDVNSKGNTYENSVLKYDYDLIDVIGKVQAPFYQIPVSVLAHWSHNLVAGKLDDAFQVKLTLGQLKVKGDWKIYGAWKVIERDAALGALNDASFGGGGTNNRGYQMGVAYNILDSVQTGVTGYYGVPEQSDYNKKQSTTTIITDLVVKF